MSWRAPKLPTFFEIAYHSFRVHLSESGAKKSYRRGPYPEKKKFHASNGTLSLDPVSLAPLSAPPRSQPSSQGWVTIFWQVPPLPLLPPPHRSSSPLCRLLMEERDVEGGRTLSLYPCMLRIVVGALMYENRGTEDSGICLNDQMHWFKKVGWKNLSLKIEKCTFSQTAFWPLFRRYASFQSHKESRPKFAGKNPRFDVFECIDGPQRIESYPRTDAPF